jgi:hypothetical protein
VYSGREAGAVTRPIRLDSKTIDPRHRYRIKAAWVSYATIQVIWVLCIFLTPVAVNLHPSKLWAVPFCCVTVANGMHMIFFRYEYNAVLRRAVRLVPYARFITPSQNDPKYFLPFGMAYAMLGVVSAILVVAA